MDKTLPTPERLKEIDQALAEGREIELSPAEIELFGGQQMLTAFDLGIDEDDPEEVEHE
jgi:hypothetical protein